MPRLSLRAQFFLDEIRILEKKMMNVATQCKWEEMAILEKERAQKIYDFFSSARTVEKTQSLVYVAETLLESNHILCDKTIEYCCQLRKTLLACREGSKMSQAYQNVQRKEDNL